MNVIKKKWAVFFATLALLTVNLSVIAWFIHSGYGLTWSTWHVLALASVVTLLLHFSNSDSEMFFSATLAGFYFWLVAPLMCAIDAVSGSHLRTASPDFLIYALSVSVMITFAFTMMAALNKSRCR